MKNKTNFYRVLFTAIGATVALVAGALMVVLYENNRLNAFGYFLILTGVFLFILSLFYAFVLRSENKTARAELLKKQAKEKIFDAALQAFRNRTDLPEKNTIKVVDAGIEFCAEGRYVCEKNFNNKRGYHFAFEISSTDVKHKREDFDVDYLEEFGVLINVGYFEGMALSTPENDNGIILRNDIENSVGRILSVKPDEGYIANVWSADGDEIDYGFVKILECKDDVLTVCFSLNVLSGLCDIVEGTVELKKDSLTAASDISTLIGTIKRKRCNTLDVSDEQLREIRQNAPFLQESYIMFLQEVGFVDLNWIDIGWHANTPTNLHDDDEKGAVQDIIKDRDDINIDDYYFFALSNDDTYYAFARDPNDKKVYCFSAELDPYSTPNETFEDFLYEILHI